MPHPSRHQLISYIAPGAPATRRPADGGEPFLRPEVGFTPQWYRQSLDIDFGQRWHVDPAYRRQTVVAMRDHLRQRFGGTRIGGIDRPDRPLELLTGVYGGAVVAAIYGISILYATDNWPNCEHRYLNDHEADALRPPDLDSNPFFQQLLDQVDWIAAHQGRAEGYVNWQGVLNNAYRLRGQALFFDLIDAPDRCRRIFDCIGTTMIDAARRLHDRQRAAGVNVEFFTVSNCLVNMISAEDYRDFLLPLDRRIAEAFDCIGVHNCAWNADPYVPYYATLPNVAYVDMGLCSDLSAAKAALPLARRAVMVTPMDLAGKRPDTIRQDLERIAREYGPCDVVAADIDVGTPDQRVLAFIEVCEEISFRHHAG